MSSLKWSGCDEARIVSDPQDLPDLAPLLARHDESTRLWLEEHRSDGDRTIVWELSSAERLHFNAQDPVDFSAEDRPQPGSIVLDRDGDGWEFGRTRWTQLSSNESKPLRMPGWQPDTQFGPYKLIGRTIRGGKPTEWRYRTIRPRKRRD